MTNLTCNPHSASRKNRRGFAPVSAFSLVPFDQKTHLSSSAGGVGSNRLDNSSISLTDSPRTLSIPEYELTRADYDLIRQYEENEGYGVGFSVNQFASGEVSAGCYSKAVKKTPIRDKGPRISKGWSSRSKKTVRRAVECGAARGILFRSFLTLTFDAKLPHVVKDKAGCVCHVFAKQQLSRFLNTLSVCYSRLHSKTGNPYHLCAFVWVAELQDNGNIHFHILLSMPFVPFTYINRIWGNGSTNIKKVKDPVRAARYMTKYMQKGCALIAGNRYNMSQNISSLVKPHRTNFYGRYARGVFLDAMQSMFTEIGSNRGRVFDWGMYIPAPCRPRSYKLPDGSTCSVAGTSSHLIKRFLSCFDDLPATYPDLPF